MRFLSSVSEPCTGWAARSWIGPGKQHLRQGRHGCPQKLWHVIQTTQCHKVKQEATIVDDFHNLIFWNYVLPPIQNGLNASGACTAQSVQLRGCWTALGFEQTDGFRLDQGNRSGRPARKPHLKSQLRTNGNPTALSICTNKTHMHTVEYAYNICIYICVCVHIYIHLYAILSICLCNYLFV